MAIDKKELYGRFDSSYQRHQRLADLATRKALDLPLEDDMNIINNRQGASMTATALLSAALLLGGGGLGLGVAGLLGTRPEGPTPSTTIPAVKQDNDATSAVGQHVTPPLAESQEFKVTFWGDDSREIRIESQEEGENSNDH